MAPPSTVTTSTSTPIAMPLSFLRCEDDCTPTRALCGGVGEPWRTPRRNASLPPIPLRLPFKLGAPPWFVSLVLYVASPRCDADLSASSNHQNQNEFYPRSRSEFVVCRPCCMMMTCHARRRLDDSGMYDLPPRSAPIPLTQHCVMPLLSCAYTTVLTLLLCGNTWN